MLMASVVKAGGLSWHEISPSPQSSPWDSSSSKFLTPLSLLAPRGQNHEAGFPFEQEPQMRVRPFLVTVLKAQLQIQGWSLPPGVFYSAILDRSVAP